MKPRDSRDQLARYISAMQNLAVSSPETAESANAVIRQALLLRALNNEYTTLLLHVRLWQIAGFVLAAAGTFASIWGFRLWYIREQLVKDSVLRSRIDHTDILRTPRCIEAAST